MITTRQLHVLKYLAAGAGIGQAASRLKVCNRTVKNDLASLYAAAGVRTHAGVVAWAIREGWIS